MNRRTFLTSALLTVMARPFDAFMRPARAAIQATDLIWRHGVSPFGELKYAADFTKFDYVNAHAPKEGVVRQAALGTYDNFNVAVAGAKGTLALGIDSIFSTLLTPALDEPSSSYGLAAESVACRDDFSAVSFRIRADARWHDGAPLTPEDVIFSFESLKRLSPHAAASYQHVARIEKTGDRDVTFWFDGPGKRDLPQVIGQMTILPKHWWSAADSEGKRRDISATTLEPPLGSGAYRIKEFSPGRSIVYERVKDCWSRTLNVQVGRDNFDEVRIEYFRDAAVSLEALKADVVDWRIENSANYWATAYDFAAAEANRVVRSEFPINNTGIMQAFAFNLRRDKFSDPRVRLAFNHAFDFEEMNKQLFRGQYTRIASYFAGTELAATGAPSGRERELLDAVRDKVPGEVFERVYLNPVNGTPAAVRDNLRQALRLFGEAGYEVDNGRLVSRKTGAPYEVEFLGNNQLFERVFQFYRPSLERLGIAVSVRTVDEPQYANRLRNWDFDIVTYAWDQSLVPGTEQYDYWGSRAAGQPGSENVIGIKNPAVDAMIEQIALAKSRDDLVAAVRALDRILLWNHYVVPQWRYGKLRAARWDRFSYRDPLPKYGIAGFPALWWWDAEKAAKTAVRR